MKRLREFLEIKQQLDTFEGRRILSRAYELKDTVSELVFKVDPELAKRCDAIVGRRESRRVEVLIGCLD